MQQIVGYTPDLSLIVSCQGQFLLDRIALSSDDETVCVSTSLPIDDSIYLAVVSMITFFTSAAMPFRTCGLEIRFGGATFTRAHFGFVEWCHAIENACNVMMELINEIVYCVCRIRECT